MPSKTGAKPQAGPGRSPELKVFISSRDSRCDECHDDLGRHAWIVLGGDDGALCLACADMDHLVFLPSGDAALTRRVRKYSALAAVVLKWSSARKRYERQGLLVEEPALGRAESECLADADARALQRERAAQQREVTDAEFVAAFAVQVRRQYPRCPQDREHEIARHACAKYSGRVGRSSAAKAFDDAAILLAVQAHVRHRETEYDRLLSRGIERHEARATVGDELRRVIAEWRG